MIGTKILLSNIILICFFSPMHLSPLLNLPGKDDHTLGQEGGYWSLVLKAKML